jgi:hypothetical protein
MVVSPPARSILELGNPDDARDERSPFVTARRIRVGIGAWLLVAALLAVRLLQIQVDT